MISNNSETDKTIQVAPNSASKMEADDAAVTSFDPPCEVNASPCRSEECRAFSYIHTIHNTILDNPVSDHKRKCDIRFPPAKDANHQLFVSGYDGRPCPAKYSALLGKKGNPQKGMGIVLRCKRWTCVVCNLFLKAQWLDHLQARIKAHDGLIFVWRGAAVPFEALKTQVQRGQGSYCRVALSDDSFIVITTVDVRDSQVQSKPDAVKYLAEAINRLPCKNGRPISASNNWKQSDNKTGEWSRLETTHDMARSNAVLEEMNVTVTADTLKPLSNAQQRFQYVFPSSFDQEAQINAFSYAALGVTPKLDEQGHPPSLILIMDELMKSVSDFPTVSSINVPLQIAALAQTAGDTPSFPEPTQGWFSNTFVTKPEKDAYSRWWIVQRDPDRVIQKRSWQSFSSREEAQALINSNAAELIDAANTISPML